MTDMLGSALSALTAYQRALATTSHNIANAKTDGYSRQSVTFATRTPDQSGALSLGTGVQATGVRRAYDQYAVEQQRSSTSGYSQQNTLHGLSLQVDTLLSDADNGLAPAVSAFFDSVHGVAADPSSLSARRLLLAGGQDLATRFEDINTQLAGLDHEVNARIKSSVSEINGLTSRIADLNKSISQAIGQGTTPNDLLDQRDLAVLELNQHVRVSTLTQADGTLSVFVGSGQSLVLGTQQTPLSVTSNRFDPSQAEVSIGSAEITGALDGGMLGGALAFREDVLTPARNQLGLIATNLASAFNSQHAAGLDLQGSAGTAFFSQSAIVPQASRLNTGSAELSVTVADASALSGKDYILRQTDSGWQLRQAGSGDSMALTGDGSAANPFQADGLSFVVAGTSADGDEFFIRPTAQAAGGLAVAISNPSAIAAAAGDGSGGAGDNRNMALLAGLESSKLMSGGRASISDGVKGLIGEVASATRSASISQASQAMLLEQASNRRESVSGVNLDEEAANLLKFQQAYQAAAQVASVANAIFQTMIDAFRR